MGRADLFEVGPIYRDATPDGQVLVAAGIRSGNRDPHWLEREREPDLFDAKADLVELLRELQVPVERLVFRPDAPEWFHPKQSGTVSLGRLRIGMFGALHPVISDSYKLSSNIVGFEFELAAIPVRRRKGTARAPITLPDLQPIRRDLAFLVDRSVTAASLMDTVIGVDRGTVGSGAIYSTNIVVRALMRVKNLWRCG